MEKRLIRPVISRFPSDHATASRTKRFWRWLASRPAASLSRRCSSVLRRGAAWRRRTLFGRKRRKTGGLVKHSPFHQPSPFSPNCRIPSGPVKDVLLGPAPSAAPEPLHRHKQYRIRWPPGSPPTLNHSRLMVDQVPSSLDPDGTKPSTTSMLQKAHYTI